MLRRGLGRRKFAVTAGQSEAVLLEDEVPTLSKVTTNSLETFLGNKESGSALLAVRNRRAGHIVRGLAHSVAVPHARALVHGRIRDVGHVRDGIIRRLEVEGLGKIGHVCAAPWGHLVGCYVVALGTQPFLDKHDLGVVVRVFCVNVATASPRADNVEWQTKARSTFNMLAARSHLSSEDRPKEKITYVYLKAIDMKISNVSNSNYYANHFAYT
jgi:hypothetical protein